MYTKNCIKEIYQAITLTLILFSVKVQKTDAYMLPDTPRYNIENSTSCEDFLKNTTFDAKSIVDVDWKIFYFWNTEYQNTYQIRFSLTSPVLVDRFRVELEEELGTNLNWTDAEMFMETSVDLSALFIKTNVSGMYTVISSLAFHVIGMPMMTFALKLTETGYLGIENCKFRLCYALAPVNSMPKEDEVLTAAAKIGFHGDNGRSYFIRPPLPPSPPSLDEPDDADDADDYI